jgi:hypothetical protein
MVYPDQLAKVQKDMGLARFDMEVNDGKTVLLVVVLNPKVKAEKKRLQRKGNLKRNMMKRLRKKWKNSEKNQGRGGRKRHANSLWKLRPTIYYTPN